MDTSLRTAAALPRLVGNTPLVPLDTIGAGLPHRLWAKCEFMNPLGSVKDRIAVHILDRAEQAGALRPGGPIVEATGGNTGIALAAVGTARGHRVVVTMSDKMGPDKVNLLRAHGAEVVICPYAVEPDSDAHFINRARALAADIPDSYYVDQFNNPWNVDAHYQGTGAEIWAALGPSLAAVVAGVGTGGTLMGIARYVRERNPAVRVGLADPLGSILAAVVRGEPPVARPYLVEGIGGDFVPGLFDPALVTDALTVDDQTSFRTCLRLQCEEGLFVGGSAGCAVAAALTLAETLPGPPGDIVAVLPETGGRAVATVFAPDWWAAHGLTATI